ncbi:MAG: hypothetical protein Q7T01_01105 [bacterium]|nr:hypothetical protein [bacterium]
MHRRRDYHRHERLRATAAFAVMDAHGIDAFLRDRRLLEFAASRTSRTKQCEVTVVWIRFDE